MKTKSSANGRWYAVDNEIYQIIDGHTYRHATCDDEGTYIESDSPLLVDSVPVGYDIPRRCISYKTALQEIEIARASERSSL